MGRRLSTSEALRPVIDLKSPPKIHVRSPANEHKQSDLAEKVNVDKRVLGI